MASAAGMVAATALSSDRPVMCVAPTCFSWATSGACIDSAAAFRALRWVWLAGRPESWLSNTTTMGSCLPDEKALTWLALSLEKLGEGEAPGVAAVAAVAVPAIAAASDIATPAPRPGSTIGRFACLTYLCAGSPSLRMNVPYDLRLPRTAQGLFKLVRASGFC